MNDTDNLSFVSRYSEFVKKGRSSLSDTGCACVQRAGRTNGQSLGTQTQRQTCEKRHVKPDMETNMRNRNELHKKSQVAKGPARRGDLVALYAS